MAISSLLLVFAIILTIIANSSAQILNQFRSSALLFPVEGDIISDGFFATTVYIGNPPKRYKLDIDTGSNITWVQCNPGSRTKLLVGPNSPYVPKNNRMLCKDPLCDFIPQPIDFPCKAPTDQCDYEVEYADSGSSLGVVVRDAFTMKLTNGSIYRTTLAFGCGYDQQFPGGSAPKVDGVLGLSDGKASIMSQLINFGASKNVIGHCFGSQRKGGFLFIGDDLFPSGITWAPLLPNSQHGYLLGPVDLVYGGKATSVKGINVIFDSGSTYTYFNPQVYQATLSLIQSGLRRPLSITSDTSLPICWKGSKPFKSVDEVKGYFSPLALKFSRAKNIVFELPLEAYLTISSHGNVCLGILNGAGEDLGNINIIGDISFLDKLIVYDNERQQIGWIPWHCNKQPKH